MSAEPRRLTDRSGWTEGQLRQTRAYLRGCIRDGRRDVYDVEEYRLILLDVEAEISRRQEAGRRGGTEAPR